MKNNFLIIFLIFSYILLLDTVFAKEIEFDASEIEISNDQNLTTANNGIVKIKDEEIIIEGVKIEYFKDKALIIVNEGKIFKVDFNIKIKSEKIKYNLESGIINFDNKVLIDDKKNNLIIYSDKINYDVSNQKLFGNGKSEIIDELNNKYELSEFDYSIKDKLIKLSNTKVTDKSRNTFELEIAYLDLNKKELIAKDIGLDFKISENSENEPRLKGRSLISDERNTIVKKGSFTFCKKREKCPPWEMSANEIRHDKLKKIIHYKGASLKIYDKKVFYFPKFFHPDPTVKRQSGFLVPRLQDNSTTGLSFKLPYFWAVSDNKDMTFNPRFFDDDKFLFQSELRQKNKESDHIADISNFFSNDNNSKGHLFYNFNKNYIGQKFDDIELDVKIEQVSDDTFLKAYKIESPIIDNYSNLTNSINFNLYNESLTINTNLNIYEDLSKKNNNDRYEYVPNFSFSKIISENYSFRSSGYYKNYNTNITEKVLINDLEFNSNSEYFDNGVINNKKFLLKNVSSDAKNSEKFKNNDTSRLIPSFQNNYIYPLQKQNDKYKYTVTPKLTLNLSTPHTKDVHKDNAIINYDNIYDINRLGIDEVNEGGVSITYGYEYTKTNITNLEQKIKFGLANNLRFEENKNLPANTNLGDKTSDFVGLLEYNPNKNIKLDYNFSLKNNLVDQNYELFGFEYYLKNLTTKFEYLNENNSNSKTSYLQNETRYNFNDNNSLIFETRENKEKNFTEYYNLIYQFQNDCLTAALEYNKEYYSDQDLKPSENLFFKLSILPFGGFNSPNLK